jgi:hypothetical protein
MKQYGYHYDTQSFLKMIDMRQIARKAGCNFPHTLATYLCKVPDNEDSKIVIAEIQSMIETLKRNLPSKYWVKQ